MTEAFEAYLLTQMAALCRGAIQQDELETCGRAEELGIFDVVTPFERVLSAFGPGKVSPPHVIAGASEALRLSVEHRYLLSRWPAFEFVILESEEGLAWGHTFVRRQGTATPTISGLQDLSRWSHVDTEISYALGSPESYETWFPWQNTIYRISDGTFSLCFVYGLLQNVQRIT